MRGLLRLLILSVGLITLAYAQASSGPEDKQYTVHVVGYAHMDMAWLWRWEESIHDIMYNTFRNQLKIMDEYPDYTYAQDQAVVFEMMEHYYPDLFKGIIQKVKTGNFIPVSSSWVQMDENLSDGESMVRQFLYGQKYTKEKFGHYVRVAWQPDVFGHPYSMPQIASKAGIDFYLFGRPADPQRSPIMWWEGIDGSRVIGYNPPGWYTQPMDHDHITVLGMKTAERVGVKDIMMLYGKGDHGGGPTPEDVAGIAKLNASPNDVQVKTTNVSDYVDLLLSEKKDFPVVKKEMEGVFTGCYTTQVEMKRHNRESEQLLLNAEKMSELATFFQYQDYVSTRDFSEAWKLVLLNQAHDLAAGSGIGPIYADAARQYDEVFERGHRALNFSLQNIGLQLDTLGEGLPVVVYNAQSWDRTDLVTAEVSGFSLSPRMVAVHGDEVVPVQIVKPATKTGARETATVVFVGQNVPQMGEKLYRLLPESAGRVSVPAVQSGMAPLPFIENEFLRVEIDPQTGHIARLYDKQGKHEALSGSGSYLTALEDTAEQARKSTEEYAGPAWDVGLTGRKWDINKAAEVELIERGPVRATVRIVHHFRDSQFTQDVSLIAGVPRVDVKMSTDWYERATFLKAVFAVNASSSKVSAEIPYGVIDRDQTGNESVMGKWVDISDANYGVAILNNGRNGYDAKDNVIRLSVIRGPWAPDPRADEGLHTFSYSIYPHRQGWREGKVVYQALAFNSPLLAMQELAHASPQEQWAGKGGGLPNAYSFIKTDSDHVVLYAMKQMEGFYDKDAIMRFYETEGRDGEVTVTFPRAVHVTETNLLEDVVLGSVGEGRTIRFHVKPWEIKTLRVALQ